MSEKSRAGETGFVIDLRSGLTDDELIEKYRLTKRGLGSLFRELVDSKSLSLAELFRRDFKDLPEMVAEFRILPRHPVEISLPLYELGSPEKCGVVYDISEDGVGVRGVHAEVDEIKTFSIPADLFFSAEPVIFQAMCCWFDEETAESPCASGFRVIDVLKGSLRGLVSIVSGLRQDTSTE